MGYYSATTKKLMDQIGEPYTTTVRSANAVMPDFTSLLLTLALMPQLTGGKASRVAENMDPNVASQIMLRQREAQMNPWDEGEFLPGAFPNQTYPPKTVVGNVVKNPYGAIFGGSKSDPMGILNNPALQKIFYSLLGII